MKVRKFVYLTYSAIFGILSAFQFKYSIPDSFVLITVSLIYIYSIFRENSEVYAIAASILAVFFATISALSMLATWLNNLFGFEKSNYLSYGAFGIFGFLSLPLILVILKGQFKINLKN